MSRMTAEDVLREISQSGARRAKVAITDIDGILRGKYISVDKLRSALSGGFGFCDVVFGWDSSDVCYEDAGIALTGWHSGYPDAEARLDPGTYRTIPWEDDVPFMLGHFVTVGDDGTEQPMGVCPRQVLRRVIATSREMGFEAMFGMEFEWFNFRETPGSLAEKDYNRPEPITPGMFGYSVLRSSLNSPFFRDLMELTADFGVPLEGLHTETGPGVLEAAITVDEALEAADRAVLFKSAAREIGYRHGIMPTFMAKWNVDLPGCSGHMHQSLWKDGQPLFAGEGYGGLSEIGMHYVAGILHHARALCALCNPSTNSYKRLVPGFEAPVNLAYSSRNRSAAVRIPTYSSSPKAIRIEFRTPDPSCNPYLAFSALMMAGLDGIERKLDPGEPLDKDIYSLSPEELANVPSVPGSLEEALDALEADHEFLLKGDVFSKDLLEAWISWKRTNEVDEVRTRPHPHEFTLYYDV